MLRITLVSCLFSEHRFNRSINMIPQTVNFLDEFARGFNGRRVLGVGGRSPIKFTREIRKNYDAIDIGINYSSTILLIYLLI